MIERIEEAPAGVLRFRAVGEVQVSDYEEVLEPALDAAVAARRPIRIVLEVGPAFERYALGAARDDVALAFSLLRSCERCAVVTDRDSVERAVRGLGSLVPGHVRTFGIEQMDEALAWVASDQD